MAELQAKLADYEKTREALTGAKGRLTAASKRLKALEWDHEVRLAAVRAVHCKVHAAAHPWSRLGPYLNIPSRCSRSSTYHTTPIAGSRILCIFIVRKASRRGY